MNIPTITIQAASFAYKNRMLFNNVNLTLSSGKTTCLLGPSGVGKSSILRLIANLKTTNSVFNGKILCSNDIPPSQQIAYMAQTDLLMPWLTALENVLISASLQGIATSRLKNDAIKLLTDLGLEKALHQYPQTLSGGMRQRVALARTLLQDKPVILMDEPFSALDAVTRFRLQTLAAMKFKNRTVLFVTHDPMEALRLADEIYILAGQPANLHHAMHLSSPTPRDPADAELISHQAELFHALMQASEKTL